MEEEQERNVEGKETAIFKVITVSIKSKLFFEIVMGFPLKGDNYVF